MDEDMDIYIPPVDGEDLVDILVGSAVAKRWGQLVPDHDEATWYAVAIAARDIFHVIMATEDPDPLKAIDEFLSLEGGL